MNIFGLLITKVNSLQIMGDPPKIPQRPNFRFAPDKISKNKWKGGKPATGRGKSTVCFT